MKLHNAQHVGMIIQIFFIFKLACWRGRERERERRRGRGGGTRDSKRIDFQDITTLIYFFWMQIVEAIVCVSDARNTQQLQWMIFSMENRPYALIDDKMEDGLDDGVHKTIFTIQSPNEISKRFSQPSRLVWFTPGEAELSTLFHFVDDLWM